MRICNRNRRLNDSFAKGIHGMVDKGFVGMVEFWIPVVAERRRLDVMRR